MKKRFLEEQILRVLRQAEQPTTTARKVCREHGVIDQTFYRWRSKYSGLEVREVPGLSEQMIIKYG